MSHTGAVLELERLEVVYEGIILALREVTLSVPQGAIVALLGANGAGKSTSLKAASGVLPAERGAITKGVVRYRGRDVTSTSAESLVKSGMVLVLEGRHCFPNLGVEENLVAGALVKRPSRSKLGDLLERTYQYFPRLREKRRAAAGYLSGGEQQMLAIGRALMGSPELILLDEPSMGLAPQIVEEIFTIVRSFSERESVSFLLAEQNANIALRYAHHGYVLENGRVAMEGSATQLSGRSEIQELYLGTRDGVRTSFRHSQPRELAR